MLASASLGFMLMPKNTAQAGEAPVGLSQNSLNRIFVQQPVDSATVEFEATNLNAPENDMGSVFNFELMYDGGAVLATDTVFTITPVGQGSTPSLATFQVTIPALQNSQMFALRIPGDNVYTGDRRWSYTVTACMQNNMACDPTKIMVGTSLLLTQMEDDPYPVLSVSSEPPAVGANAISESEDKNIVFTVTNSEVSTSDITVAVDVTGVTASAGDFTVTGLTNGELGISQGATSATFAVMLNTDAVAEPDETLTVSFGAVTAGGIVPMFTPVLYTITISGALVTQSFDYPVTVDLGADRTVQETDTDVAHEFTISYANARVILTSTVLTVWPVGQGQEVPLTAVNVTIPTMANSATYAITVPGDNRYDGDRVYTVMIAQCTQNGNACEGAEIITTDTLTLTVEEDEAGPSLSISPAVTSITEKEGASVTFTVINTQNSQGKLTIPVNVAVGTAVAADFSVAGLTSGNLEIDDGATMGSFMVSLTDDNAVEALETLTVGFGDVTPEGVNPKPAFTPQTYTITIEDTDTAVVTASGGGAVVEGASRDITISLDKVVHTDVEVMWTITNGQDDFTAHTGTVMLSAGTTSTMAQITATDDSIVEVAEQFDLVLALVNPVARVSAQNPAANFLSITDNDQVVLSFESDVSAIENGDADFKVLFKLSSDSAVSSSHTYQVTATESTGTNSPIAPVNVVIGSGVTSQAFELIVPGDDVVKADRKYTISISSCAGSVLCSSVDISATATLDVIEDDDKAAISVVPSDLIVEVTEGNMSEFRVVSSTPAAETISFTVVTEHVSSEAADFTLADLSDTTLTIEKGKTYAVFTLNASQDDIVEPNGEELKLAITNIITAISPTPIFKNITYTVKIIDAGDSATISAGNPITIAEGEAGIVAVKLDKQVDQDVTLQWTITGTDPGNDFSSISGDVVLPKLSIAEVQIPIQTVENTMFQADRKYGLMLAVMPAVPNVAVTQPAAEFITVDDDDNAGVSFGADREITETNVDAPSPITLSYPAGVQFNSDITYTLTFTETTNSGIVIAPVSLTIANGDESGSANATIPGDDIVHLDRVYTVSITGCDDGGSGNCAGIQTSDTLKLTVKDDDKATLGTDVMAELNESGSTVFNVTLDKLVAVPLTVTISVNSSPLVNSIQPTVVSFARLSAAASSTVSLEISDDNVVESDKVFGIHLTATTAIAGVSDIADILTINNPVSSVTVKDSDTVGMSVSLVSPPSGNDYAEGATITLRISYTGGTVDEDTRFTLVESTTVEPVGSNARPLIFPGNSKDVTISKGASFVDVELTTAGDVTVNRNVKTNYTVTVTNCSGNLCGPRINTAGANASFSVSDDDDSRLTLDSPAVSRTVVEGAQVVPALLLSNPYEGDLTVQFSTLSQGDTSDAGDKTVNGGSASPVSVRIPAGDLRALIDITAVDDNVVEGDETFTLSNFAITTAGIPSAIVNAISGSAGFTITDNDDAAITVSRVGSGAVAEGGTVSFRFAISQPVKQGVSLSWSIADPDGDISGSDSGTVQFAALDTDAKFVNLAVSDDSIVEAQETFTFQASAPAPVVPRVSLTGTTAHAIVVSNTDKATVELVSTTATAPEGGSISYTLRYAGGATVAEAVSFEVSVTGVSANADLDNVGLRGGGSGTVTNGVRKFTVSIPSNNASVGITIDVSDDSVVVGNRKYSLSIAKDCGSGQNINALCRDHVSGTPSTEFTVAEDDTAPPATASSSNRGVKFASRPSETEVEVSEPAQADVVASSTIQERVLVQFSTSASSEIKSLKTEDVSGESAVPSAPSRVNFVRSYDLTPVDTSNAELSQVDATVCLPLNGAFKSDRIFAVYHSADSVNWDRLRSSISAERTHVCADTEEFSYFALGYIQLSEDEEDRLLPPTGGILPNIGLLLMLGIIGFALLLMGGLYVSLRLRSVTDNRLNKV